MRIIERYIIKRIFILFIAVLLASVGISWTVQILTRINFLTTTGQTFLSVIKFSALFLPSAIVLVVPFAFVIAIAQVLSTMNQDSELVVINASGAPRGSVWKPVIFLAILLSIFSFVMANYISPIARLTMRQMMASAHSDLINTVIQEGTFRQLTNSLYMEIGQRNDDGTIGRLFIADQRDPTTSLLYYALDGAVTSNDSGDYLVLKNGEVKRQDNESGDTSIIKFESYVFNLGEFTTSDGTPAIYPKDRPISYLFKPDVNDKYYQQFPQQFTAELHRRFSEWLYPLVFAFIALAFAGDARSHRQARVSASFSAISLSLLVYWLGYYFGDRAENSLVFVPMLYIIPLSVMGVIIFALLTNRKIALPSKYNDKIRYLFDKVKDKFERKNNPKGLA